MGNEASSFEEEGEETRKKVSKQEERKLSNVEIRLVKQLWAEARRKGPYEPGRSILSSVFIRDPEINKIVERFGGRKVTLGSPTADRQFVRKRYDFSVHAKSFTQGMDEIISNLTDQKYVEKYLQDLGRKHACIMTQSLPVKVWDVFGGSMIEKTFEWGGWKQRSTISQKAWGSVVQLIIENMKVGFYSECKRLNQRGSAQSFASFTEDITSPRASLEPCFSGRLPKSASAINVSFLRDEPR